MTTVAEVRLWGRTIGAVSLNDGADVTAFEYAPPFTGSGIELAPLTMPLARRIYTFPELSRQTFHGLPGLLADSLPDKFGTALIDAWLATQGRQPDSLNAVERLCYTGRRGMGALEFVPTLGPRERRANHIQIDQLVELAAEVLTQRHNLQASLANESREQALAYILRIGTSAGGARAKAVIAWNPATNEVRSGQVPVDDGFEHWLLKFDGVRGNRDKEIEESQGYGLIEYAYYLMARECQINISESRLLAENGRQHFMTRRFDRLPGLASGKKTGGAKLHQQSLCALAHYDFNLAGAYSYEQALLAIRQLELPVETIEEQFRRMVFNIVARNQDDHVKNIAFLMNKSGQWSLAPAFDLTYNFNPTGNWTGKHQMTLNGKRDDFKLADFETCARGASMKRGRAKMIIDEVQTVVSNWDRYAKEAGVPPAWRDRIYETLRLDKF